MILHKMFLLVTYGKQGKALNMAFFTISVDNSTILTSRNRLTVSNGLPANTTVRTKVLGCIVYVTFKASHLRLYVLDSLSCPDGCWDSTSFSPFWIGSLLIFFQQPAFAVMSGGPIVVSPGFFDRNWFSFALPRKT
jgi:hypothetical protein